MAYGWRRRERFDEYDDHYLYLRHRNRRHATITGFCLFAAFILFLFVALSLPIIKNVYLLQINGHPSSLQPTTSIGTELRFGVWGFCVTRFASLEFCSPPPPPSSSFILTQLTFSDSWSRVPSLRFHCHIIVHWINRHFSIITANALVQNLDTQSIRGSLRS